MIIAVGSTNTIKVQAVEEIVREYPSLAKAQILSFPSPSEVSDQPLSLEETIQGAKNRAKNAFLACGSCTYSIGIESGLCTASGTTTGLMNICVGSIYDGVHHHIGFSTGFEIPPEILKLITEQKMDLAEACYCSGITSNANIGTAEGLIGILTNGRTNRKEYAKQCITTALIQLEHARWYPKS